MTDKPVLSIHSRADLVFVRQHSGIPPTPSDAPLRGWMWEALSMAGFVAFVSAVIYFACRF